MSRPSCHDGTCVRRDLHSVPSECAAVDPNPLPRTMMDSDHALAELRQLCALWSPDTGLDPASTALLVQNFMWLDNAISTGGYLPDEWDPDAWDGAALGYVPRPVSTVELPGPGTAEAAMAAPETGPTRAPAVPPGDRQA